MDRYIDRGEALRFMGMKEAPEGRFLELLAECEREVARLAEPRYTYKVFDKDALSDVLLGEDIKEHLEGCEKVIVFAATLGLEIDRYINRLQVLEMASAVAADAVASACIEGFCREADAELSAAFAPLHLTWRFSPGYGDFPIELQRKLLTLIEADKRIGLHVTESCMLLPVKSVTAVIGVSDKPVKKDRQSCAVCKMKDTCAFRKEGEHCGYKSTS
ncbi:MAG: hypothetical protein E7660_02890 [Ruminococcaceae bacterium]|nr:hypothetical protein [Oscillospiraceae bacterium]